MALPRLPSTLVPLRRTSRTITRKKFGGRTKTTHRVVPNLVETRPKTAPMQLKSQRLSELGLRLAWNLPSTFGESGSLRGPPARRIIKAKKRKTNAQGGADNEVCENFFRSSCGPAPVGGLHVCEKPRRRKNRRRSSAECRQGNAGDPQCA